MTLVQQVTSPKPSALPTCNPDTTGKTFSMEIVIGYMRPRGIHRDGRVTNIASGCYQNEILIWRLERWLSGG